jgi:hypothetical protein
MSFPKAVYRGFIEEWAHLADALRSGQVEQLVARNAEELEELVKQGFDHADQLIVSKVKNAVQSVEEEAQEIERKILSLKKGE